MMTDQAERVCDMRGGNKLSLFLDNEGDIHVSVLPEKHIIGISVEFCNSGCQSRRTRDALYKLMEAMLEDEAENSHSAYCRLDFID
jgi:hypothetical protein